MRSPALAIMAMLLFGGVAAQTDTPLSAVQDITPAALRALLTGPRVHVIDVNDADNYELAHVPGATHMEYDAIDTTALPFDRSDTLVFYWWSPECPAAGMAAASAAKLGFTHVYCMHAGITGWQDAGLPTEP
ncbi:MAG: rhodanese-like domain-containing protein [Flavobacteriales bacterium]